jgi:nitroimidazol reductase NimA-like FMN-containing flavoprotein (pyridoxamine 5'-phosphate oxidase superfamily)
MKKAKEAIEKILYITIATADEQGQPWNTPVYSAYDSNYNFYWASWEKAQHSQNIEKNPKIFLVIYDSTVPEGTGFGVYIQARAEKLLDKNEIHAALQYLYERKNKKPRQPEEFLGEYPRRVYKAIPEKVWINDDAEVNGNFIDNRKEIAL